MARRNLLSIFPGKLSLLFIGVLLPMLVCYMAFVIASGWPGTTTIVKLFIINFPVCLGVGVIDLATIQLAGRYIRHNLWMRVAVSSSLSTILCMSVLLVLNIWLEKDSVSVLTILQKMALFVPFNCILILECELFFHVLRQSETEKEKARYQMQMLRNQLNPHFLFNSLNVLSSMIYESPEHANRFVKKLSRVFRYMLDSSDKEHVALAEELKFTEAYIYLLKERYEDSVVYDISITQEYLSRLIIPTSLQQSVENAIKHNVHTSTQPLLIRIHATDDGQGVEVSNTFQPCQNVGTRKGQHILASQYQAYGKDIKTEVSDGEYRVLFPFVG